jgi:cellobiose epimerase
LPKTNAMYINRQEFLKKLGLLGLAFSVNNTIKANHKYSQVAMFTREAFWAEFKNIINFWQKYAPDNKNGGFVGAAGASGLADYTAAKGIVLNSRILWTFARAIEVSNNKTDKANYQKICERALNYINKYFWDQANGGLYWAVTPTGQPHEQRKLMYGHSFCVYGASEFARVSGSKAALKLANDTFDIIIAKAYDPKNGGYIEALGPAWEPIDDYILAKGPARKSMNTHLHLLECFASLYRVNQSEKVRFHLAHCLDMMLQHIIGDGNNRMTLFFTDNWQPLSTAISYGHDIEAAWLIQEAAEILGHEPTTHKVKNICLQLATAAAEGLQHDLGMIYEFEPSTAHSKANRDWWVQAEAMVGFMNAYKLSGQEHFLAKAQNSWQFIQLYLIDKQHGDWHGGVSPAHKVLGTEKINMWKCPYHNARACLEMMARL